jgi:small subunit ribosomal protein S16
MSVRIRLKRTGTKNAASHRIVVIDQRSQRDGRAIEYIGYYDPRHKDEKINVESYDLWVSRGAQPTDTVKRIAERAKDEKPLSAKPVKKKLSKKAQEKAKAKAEESAKASQEENANAPA